MKKSLLIVIVTIIGFIAGTITITEYIQKHLIIDLTGVWELELKIKESEFNRYVIGKLEIGYKINFSQSSEKIVGKGEKCWEFYNGIRREYEFSQRTLIHLEGNVEKNIIMFTIYEEGKRRDTTGILRLIQKNKNVFEGEFESSAANSKGTAILRR